MAIDLGDTVPLSVKIYDSTGALANAGSVSLTITQPDATNVVIPTVTPTSTGVYEHDFPTIQSGRHIYRWVATGANASAYTEAFDVLDSTPHYIISMSDAKKQLNISDTSADDELRTYLEAATDVVERVRGEAMVQRQFVEEHEIMGAGRMSLSRPPIVSLISVVSIDGWISWDVNSLHVNSKTGVVSTALYTGLLQLYGRVQVTYTAGYSIIPATFQLAASMIVNHLWQTQRGTRGAPRVGGALSDTTMVPGFAFAVPNRALELLGSGMPGFA